MALGITINNNYMARPMLPMYGTYNRMFDMMMTYSMFQFFLNSFMRPQTYQQPVYVQPIMIPQRQPQACYNIQNIDTCQSIYPDVSFNNNVCPEFDLFEGSKLFSNSEFDITSLDKENPFVSKTYEQTPKNVNKKGMFLKGKGKGSEYGPKFLARVKEIAKNVKCDYRDLLAIMNSESGIDAKIVGHNGASGLICFMPQYFDVAKIRKMSPMEQLDLVEKTLLQEKKNRKLEGATLSKENLYTLVFLPARVNRQVLCKKGEVNPKTGELLRYYEGNKGLDKNNDGMITKEEMASRIDNKYVSDESFLS